MPRNDEHGHRSSDGVRAGETGSADDFIARLVGEIVDSAGGQVTDFDGELSTIERRLAALREEEANPPPPPKPARLAAPPAPAVPSVSLVGDLERREPPPRREPSTGSVVQRRLSSEERLAALRALSDDLTEAETAARQEVSTGSVTAASNAIVPTRPRSPSSRNGPSIDDVIVDAARAAGAEPEFVAGGRRPLPQHHSSWLTAILSLVVVMLSGLLALSWLSPTGARGLLDGSVWRQAVALIGGADDIAVQTIAVADISCEPAAGELSAQQALAQLGFPALASAAEPSEESRMPVVEPLSHGLRVVKTYRVGPDGRVEVPGAEATIPSRQALAEHSGNY